MRFQMKTYYCGQGLRKHFQVPFNFHMLHFIIIIVVVVVVVVIVIIIIYLFS